jgi:cyclic-di-AMP phosphodiesterase PgpH
MKPIYWSYTLLVGVVVVISFMHSNPSPFRYEFDKGQPWLYPDLVAPFEYAIEKSETEIKREQQRLQEQSPDFYQYQSEVEADLTVHFLESFKNQSNGSLGSNTLPENIIKDSTRYIRFGKTLLKQIYSTGILHLSDKATNNYGIQLMRNNTAEERAIDQFYNIEDAAVFLRDSIASSKLPDAIAILPLLREALQPNIIYDEELSTRYRTQALNDLNRYKGMVRKNEVVVTKNSIITEETYQKLLTLQHFFQKQGVGEREGWWFMLGYFICTSIIFILYTWFLNAVRPTILQNTRHFSFLLLSILAYVYLVYWIDDLALVSIYAIPFCIVPIIVSNFYGGRIAMVTHLAIVLLVSYLTAMNNAFAFLFIQCMAGLTAVLAKAGTRSWSRFFFALEYIFLAYFLSFIGLSLIRQGNLVGLDWAMLKWLGISVFLTLLASPLVPIVERLFGYTSDVTLLELSDLEHPLLKEMSINAPGTLQHSLQVANLAEAAASAIGANALLVRVAALYHDIGKMIQPTFYIENQMGESPHAGKTAQESTDVIIQHVTKGARMGAKHRLPSIIIDFILTHHGTTRVEYFWRQHQEEVGSEQLAVGSEQQAVGSEQFSVGSEQLAVGSGQFSVGSEQQAVGSEQQAVGSESTTNTQRTYKEPTKNLDDSTFRYPGPKPRTREEAILMLADSVEAAAKSLKEPNEHDINLLVDKIINHKTDQTQLDDSNLSFRELQTIRNVFKKLLKSIYHVRIEYPK